MLLSIILRLSSLFHRFHCAIDNLSQRETLHDDGVKFFIIEGGISISSVLKSRLSGKRIGKTTASAKM